MNAWEFGVLILGDDPLIAMDVESMLAAVGVAPIMWLSSCSEADAWLRDHTPGAAILDVLLNDGPCAKIAETLSRRNIPFAVCSAAHEEEAGKAFEGAVWLPKPSDARSLISFVGKALGSSRPVVNPLRPAAFSTWRPPGFL